MRGRVFASTTAPTVADDVGEGLRVGDLWVDTTTPALYVLTDSTLGAAVWLDLTAGGGGGGGGAPTTSTYVVRTSDAGLSAERVLTDSASVAWDWSVGGVVTGSVPAGSITDARLRNSAGLSVVGRAAATTGSVADITASANGDVLRMSGGTLGWGAIPESSVTGLVSDLAALTAAIAAIPPGGVFGTITLDLLGALEGSFVISDAGLTLGMAVLVSWQPTDDEAELDSIFVVARAATAGAAQVSWRATGPRHGNHTFAYSGG